MSSNNKMKEHRTSNLCQKLESRHLYIKNMKKEKEHSSFDRDVTKEQLTNCKKLESIAFMYECFL